MRGVAAASCKMLALNVQHKLNTMLGRKRTPRDGPPISQPLMWNPRAKFPKCVASHDNRVRCVTAELAGLHRDTLRDWNSAWHSNGCLNDALMPGPAAVSEKGWRSMYPELLQWGSQILRERRLAGQASTWGQLASICLECDHFRAAAMAALVESRELATAEGAEADEENVALHRRLQWRLQQLMGRMGFSARALQTEHMASVKMHTPTRIAGALFLFNFFTTVDLTRFLIYQDESFAYEQEIPHFSTSETEPYRTTQTLPVIQHPSAPSLNSIKLTRPPDMYIVLYLQKPTNAARPVETSPKPHRTKQTHRDLPRPAQNPAEQTNAACQLKLTQKHTEQHNHSEASTDQQKSTQNPTSTVRPAETNPSPYRTAQTLFVIQHP